MTSQDRLPLELRAAYLALHRRSDAVFARQGVTADQFVLLSTLADGKALTQRQLAQRMPSDPSTVRAMLVLLEKNGLVSRTRHPSDGRAKTVALTPAGQRSYLRAFRAGKSVRDRMARSLGEKDLETLLDLLRRVSDALAGPPKGGVGGFSTNEKGVLGCAR